VTYNKILITEVLEDSSIGLKAMENKQNLEKKITFKSAEIKRVA